MVRLVNVLSLLTIPAGMLPAAPKGEESTFMLGIVVYPGLPEIWSLPGIYLWVTAWAVAFAGVWFVWKKGK